MGGVLKSGLIYLSKCLVILLLLNTKGSIAQKVEELLLEKANNFANMNQLDSAEYYYETLIKNPKALKLVYDSYFKLGILYYNNQKQDRALTIFYNILNLDAFRRTGGINRKYYSNIPYISLMKKEKECKYIVDYDVTEKKMNVLSYISKIYRDKGRYKEARKLLLRFNKRKCKKFSMDISALTHEALISVKAHKYLQKGKAWKSIAIIIRGMNKIHKQAKFGKYLIEDLHFALSKYYDGKDILNAMNTAPVKVKLFNPKLKEGPFNRFKRVEIIFLYNHLKIRYRKNGYSSLYLIKEQEMYKNMIYNPGRNFTTLKTTGISPDSEFYINMEYFINKK